MGRVKCRPSWCRSNQPALTAQDPDACEFPGKHRHGRDTRPYLALDAELFRVHLATVENPVEKAPLVLRQLEEERESFPAQLHGLCNPRIDIARVSEQVAGQADGEIAAKLV